MKTSSSYILVIGIIVAVSALFLGKDDPSLAPISTIMLVGSVMAIIYALIFKNSISADLLIKNEVYRISKASIDPRLKIDLVNLIKASKLTEARDLVRPLAFPEAPSDPTLTNAYKVTYHNIDLIIMYATGVVKKVTIAPAETACPACKTLAAKKYDIEAAINKHPLPCKDCSSGTCRCTYIPV